MIINNTPLYDKIWDWVYDTLRFSPNGLDDSHDFPFGPPFKIPFVHTVYGIDRTSDKGAEVMDPLIQQALLNSTSAGSRLFALDWQHDCFLYDPRTPKEQWTENPADPDGRYPTFFPDFYPDGDYYFFIDEHLQFGYLGHPWRQEVWIFGQSLTDEFEKIYHLLGWYKL